MKIEIPDISIVMLVGPKCSGKSYFAAKNFKPTEILSSDDFRAMISDSSNNTSANVAAGEVMHTVASKRADFDKISVIDSCNLNFAQRDEILKLAKEKNIPVVVIVFNMPTNILVERSLAKYGKEEYVVKAKKQNNNLYRQMKNFKREGFKRIFVFNSPEEVENAEIEIVKSIMDKKDLIGPFDIIGDVHGCYGELIKLITSLGYVKTGDVYIHPEGRKLIFIGDLCDRGPKSIDVIRLVMEMVHKELAYCVLGNHDEKFARYLEGHNVKISSGLGITAKDVDDASPEFKAEIIDFINNLPHHLVFDRGRLVVAHAGIKEEYINRNSNRVRTFCLYGDITGEKDANGFPVRRDWAAEYKGKAFIVYGHTFVGKVEIRNNTCCLDTGCVFGGKLSSISYPEKKVTSVLPERMYDNMAAITQLSSSLKVKTIYTSKEDMLKEPPENFSEGDLIVVTGDRIEDAKIYAMVGNSFVLVHEFETDDMLKANDICTTYRIDTKYMEDIQIKKDFAETALERANKYGVAPSWMIYLPPTMSPAQTSTKESYLEYPDEAFAYYRDNGIEQVVCEEKHMGSRAVIVLCSNTATAANLFGAMPDELGIIYTRTGNRFFGDNINFEKTILSYLYNILTKKGFWEVMHTDMVCIDAEIMPWNSKGEGLLKYQYGPVGASAKNSLSKAVKLLELAVARGNDETEVNASTSGQSVNLSAVLEDYKEKQQDINAYIHSYGNYCWKVNKVEDLRIAPFFILATGDTQFFGKSHLWHLNTINEYFIDETVTNMFVPTDRLLVNVNEASNCQFGVDWWLKKTEAGAEGMVVKPLYPVSLSNEGKLVQPAIKCRGKEYLRIIYGPEYDKLENLQRLKSRSLAKKRFLARAEYCLGMEAIDRFIHRESVTDIYKCSFGVLAMESDPTDPRL